MKLQQILEKWLEGSRAPYYHWTDLFSAHGIIKMDGIGTIDRKVVQRGPGVIDIVPEFDANQYVSLTRDKKYRVKGYASTVCFALDGEKLRQTFKLKPYADYSSISNRPASLGGPRQEAEEYVRNVIRPLDKYLLNIYIDPGEYGNLKSDYDAAIRISQRKYEDEDLSKFDKLSPEWKEKRLKSYPAQFARYSKDMKEHAAEVGKLLFHSKLVKGLP
jgi:hypothetical protein